MAQPSPAVLELARRLLRHEAGELRDPESLAAAVDQVCGKLRDELESLIGPGGSSALIRRAIILAKRGSPSLDGVNADTETNGHRPDLAESLRRSTPEHAEAASRAILGHLVGLLVDLMGEDLGLRPIHKIWPDLASDEPEPSSTETEG